MPIPEVIQEPLLSGDLEKAEPLLRQCLKDDPENHDAYLELTRILLAKREIEEAEPMIVKMLETLPNYKCEALSLRGLLHEINGRLDEAQKDYEEALTVNPNDPSVCYNLGRLFVSAVEMDDETAQKAEEMLKKAVKITPEHFPAHFQLAALYTRLNRPMDAIQACERTISHNPLHIPAYLFLGEIFSLLGEVDQVINLYKAGLRVNPLAHAFRDELIRLYRIQNKLEAAFETALEQSQMRGAYEDFLELGRLALQTEQAQTAEVAFLKAADVNQEDWRAPYNLAEIYRGAELLDKARSFYEQALLLAEAAPIYTGLAVILSQLEDEDSKEKALLYFQEAMELEPDVPEYLLNYCYALQDANRAGDIADVLTKFEPLIPEDSPALTEVRSLIPA